MIIARKSFLGEHAICTRLPSVSITEHQTAMASRIFWVVLNNLPISKSGLIKENFVLGRITRKNRLNSLQSPIDIFFGDDQGRCQADYMIVGLFAQYACFDKLFTKTAVPPAWGKSSTPIKSPLPRTSLM